MKKLIIFDYDGVLVDSEIIANQVDAQLLTELGYSITTEECIKKFTGISLKGVEKIIANELGILFPHNFEELRAKTILSALEKEVTPLMLTLLNNPTIQSLKRCIASSSWIERILKTLYWTHQDHLFPPEFIFHSGQVKKGKPAPDLFLFAAQQMNVHPDECIVIEDSMAGIEAAGLAQMDVIGFLGGSHAQFDWYQKRINSFGVPLVKNEIELLNYLHGHFIFI